MPGFAEAATIFGGEHCWPRMMPRPAGRARHGGATASGRLAGQLAAVTDSVLRPGEVLVFDGASPSFRAMSIGQPVRSITWAETVERLTGVQGAIRSRRATARSWPFRWRPEAVLGCATSGGSPASLASRRNAVAGSWLAGGDGMIREAVHRERWTALALHRGLLPAARIPTGLEVAHGYMAEGEAW